MYKRIFWLVIVGISIYSLPFQVIAEDMVSASLKEAEQYVTRVKEGKAHNAMTGREVVPNADVATEIAVSAWTVIYGQENLNRKQPFVAHRVDDVWYVGGSLLHTGLKTSFAR